MKNIILCGFISCSISASTIEAQTISKGASAPEKSALSSDSQPEATGSANLKALPGATASNEVSTEKVNNPSVPSKTSNLVTPTEWQQLRVARAAAMKANPALLKKAAELSKRMQAFRQKLDAAMIKANPSVAPTVAKLENGGPGPKILRPSNP